MTKTQNLKSLLFFRSCKNYFYGKIFYGKHEINQDDINSIVEVLKSNNLTQGPKIKEFELAFADYIGSKYAVAVSSGTAALHLCAISLE